MTAVAALVARQRQQADRQAALLAAIQAGPHGRWKSGRAVRVLRDAGHHPVSPGTASRDLQALVVAGHLIRHGTPGCTWYEPKAVTQ
ncbi:hypothetical protein [Streptomyces antibioticus]|uniref:Uncharacterized protein n=1 Tax=Streptomyces antibioticus TaxID=1890 RepID=A0AAE6YCV6_STRAT|nr:hypothetical protein [Streptomyces antibioticus]OOQ47266.1 hypothetical protein AFM16_31450 [Streptomyces antibioticus]QIT47583.1 hypothetical protein HCX60_32000 [Streptomyces antibioticus]